MSFPRNCENKIVPERKIEKKIKNYESDRHKWIAEENDA